MKAIKNIIKFMLGMDIAYVKIEQPISYYFGLKNICLIHKWEKDQGEDIIHSGFNRDHFKKVLQAKRQQELENKLINK